MKNNILAMLLLFVMSFSLVACGDTVSKAEKSPPDTEENSPNTSPAAEAETENKTEDEVSEVAYEIAYSNARTYTNSIGTIWVQVIVAIQNTGRKDLYLSSGSYDLEDENGRLIASSTMVSAYPNIISPGEIGFMYEETILDTAVDGSLVVQPRLSVKESKRENIRFAVTDLEFSTDILGGLKALGRVENTSNTESSMTYIVIILADESGNPIGQLFTILTENLAPGAKVGFEASDFSLPDDVMDATVYYIAYAYPLQMQF